MKALFTVIFLTMLFPAMVSASDSYLCIADMATGFDYNKISDNWEQTTFKVDSLKYIVSRSEMSELMEETWNVKKVGDPVALIYCKKDFSQEGFLSCEGLSDFHMNRKNLRFLTSSMLGYYTDNLSGFEDVRKGSLYVGIGKCSPL